MARKSVRKRTMNDHFRTQAKAHGFSDALIERFVFLDSGEMSEEAKEEFAAGMVRTIYKVAGVVVSEDEDDE